MKSIFFTIKDFAIHENLFSGIRNDKLNSPMIFITNSCTEEDNNDLHHTKNTIRLVTKDILLKDNANRIINEDTQMHIQHILNDSSSCGFVLCNEAVKDGGITIPESIDHDIHLDKELLNKIADILKNQNLELKIYLTTADFTNLASLKIPKAIYQISYSISSKK